MSAYVVAQLEVHDPATFARYLAEFGPVLTRHGGEIVALSPDGEVLEGNWPLPRTVVMRFPTAEDARRWHADPDYAAIAELRRRASRATIVLVDGAD